ncbi:CLUMA_CG000310, isoform A [Clunio marinus]|uniref:CLUMA_CG000310, isoform A n=1 Tax=Clunio marinus TaxID=568069 RepID=A0A1J1HJG6_9DIPT|nr:CLUMA_CG000310, isoform A [Clunio marinus]
MGMILIEYGITTTSRLIMFISLDISFFPRLSLPQKLYLIHAILENRQVMIDAFADGNLKRNNKPLISDDIY